MFDELSIKRRGQQLWEIHIRNGEFTRDTIVNHGECATYLDKATELIEDIASKTYRAMSKDLE